jgi:maltose/moltooligosaccharide transporter
VIPQIINAIIGGPIVQYLYHDNAIYALITSGVSFIIAAVLVVRVKDVDDTKTIA